jgi:hypothetical protein
MPALALAMRKKPYKFRPSSENRAPESSGRDAQFPSARSLTRSLNHSAKTRLQRIRPKYAGASDDCGDDRVALLGRSSRRGSPLTRRVCLAESSGKANTAHHAMCQRPDVPHSLLSGLMPCFGHLFPPPEDRRGTTWATKKGCLWPTHFHQWK